MTQYVGSADVVKKLVAIWRASTLDAAFQAYWTVAGDTAKNQVLNDTNAEGIAPYPYCIFELAEHHVIGRMSGSANTKYEIREHPLTFTIHAKDDGDTKSGKEVAAELMAAVLAVFGGHPTTRNSVDGVTLDNGSVLISTFQSDFAKRESIENWAWVIRYTIRVDVPVAV